MDLKESFVAMLFDWPIGTVIGALMIVLGLVVIFIIGVGIFHAADSWFRPRKKGQGIVKGKTFTPQHEETTWIYDITLKMSMPHTEVIPDTWEIEVGIAGGSDSIEVEKKFFDSINKDDFVLVEYAQGRLSNNLYVKGVSKM